MKLSYSMFKANNVTFRQSKYFVWLPLIIILLLFIIAKISQLALPHYWDESWSYATAVQKMYEQGPTLLPGKIDVDFTRGHPLFFYAAAASWMKVFGAGLFSKHCFALFISLLLIISLYTVCFKLFNIRVAVMASLLLCLQIFFFVQSSMLLPEVLVALLVLLGIYFYVVRKYWALSLSLTLLLLTKESGFVLGIILAAFFLLDIPKFLAKERFRMFIALFIPALIVASFFIYQKHIYGWYFFPEHLDYIDYNIKDVTTKFVESLSIVFLGEKRKWFWGILILITLSVLIFKKEKREYVLPVLFIIYVILLKVMGGIVGSIIHHYIVIIIIALIASVYSLFSYRVTTSPRKRLMLLAGLFCLLYSVFCAVNFFTIRYLLPALVLSVLFLAVWLDSMMSCISWKMYIPVSLIIILLSVQSFVRDNDKGDTGMGSYQALSVERDLINYLSKHHMQEANIGYGSFQQRVNMQHKACGFINDSTSIFKNVQWDIDSTTQYAVFDNIEEDNRYDSIKQSPHFRLLFSTHHKKIWGEVYKRVYQ